MRVPCLDPVGSPLEQPVDSRVTEILECIYAVRAVG